MENIATTHLTRDLLFEKESPGAKYLDIWFRADSALYAASQFQGCRYI